ncbi:hypothetical protein KFZ76_01440 [Methylovulum psychrotolerans]|jgi:hypothetical protein|uniref:hypothetical protein n=1 Tax=Methylovulum psychrotolerans TaxID=1704499 RepID=UPI001BFFA2CF|nr:hypothetical protein [Methylovulum psychrotolerans]MBT9096373.1 hypothetical protein [Methylovulum psychrotolerans]
MFDIVKRLFEICLFKKGPQDLPYRLSVLKMAVAANMLVSFLMLHMDKGGLRSVLQTVVGIALEVFFAGLCLYSFGKLARFWQTASALLGTDALLSFFALPVMATLILQQGGVAVFLVMVAIIIWHWAVVGHILRHALDKHISFSLGLALLYLVASYKVMALLFPELPSVN